jgi:hypothetical protein
MGSLRHAYPIYSWNLRLEKGLLVNFCGISCASVVLELLHQLKSLLRDSGEFSIASLELILYSSGSLLKSL